MATTGAAAPTTSAEPQTSTSDSRTQEASSSYECPFCVMMRKGGCEAPFKAFMDCGEKADKGDQEMAECVQYFEALHVCMEKNKAVFDELLVEMKSQESEGKEQQQQQQQEQPAGASEAPPADTATCSSDSAGAAKATEADTAPLEAAAAVASMAAASQHAPAA